ncbi:MAG: class I SAM-dependent methyltransferase [Patescibacteria group bacterium]
MKSYRPGTFDSRVIQYEKVHQITVEQISALEDAVGLKIDQKILDGCCGYGSVTKWLITDTNKQVTDTCQFFLFDDSPVQIERAKENLANETNIKFEIGDIRSLPYEDNFFDTVIIKMGLHENPKVDQIKIIAEVFRVLKPGGKFVIWELYLNHLTQPIFQSFIQKKDELAGFNALVQKRYFPRKDELREALDTTGFMGFTEHYVFNPVLGTKVRSGELISRELKEQNLSEPNEKLLTIAKERLDLLNNFFRNSLSTEQKNTINFKDEGDNITIYNIDKAIISALKPQ